MNEVFGFSRRIPVIPYRLALLAAYGFEILAALGLKTFTTAEFKNFTIQPIFLLNRLIRMVWKTGGKIVCPKRFIENIRLLTLLLCFLISCTKLDLTSRR